MTYHRRYVVPEQDLHDVALARWRRARAAAGGRGGHHDIGGVNMWRVNEAGRSLVIPAGSAEPES